MRASSRIFFQLFPCLPPSIHRRTGATTIALKDLLVDDTL